MVIDVLTSAEWKLYDCMKEKIDLSSVVVELKTKSSSTGIDDVSI